MRRCSRRTHSQRTTSARYVSYVKWALAAFSARSPKLSAIPERCSLRSMAWSSSCTSGMSCGQQTVVDGHVDLDRSEHWQTRRHWRADEIPHGVKARWRSLVQQESESELYFRLGGARCQVQDPHVVAIGALWLADAQCIVDASERKTREQVVVVAVLGKGAGLADQGPDHMAIIDTMLAVAEQPRHAQQVTRTPIHLQHLGPYPYQQPGSDQSGRNRIGVAQHLDRAEAADPHAQFAAQRQPTDWQRAQHRLLLGP